MPREIPEKENEVDSLKIKQTNKQKQRKNSLVSYFWNEETWSFQMSLALSAKPYKEKFIAMFMDKKT